MRILPEMQDSPPPQRIHWGRPICWQRGQVASRSAPIYESIVRLGPMRYGLTVRQANGERAIRELARVWLSRF
jgi:hypothetical protein